MLDKFYYQNNKGERLTFGAGGLYANYNDLRDYEWSYDSTDDVITDFRKGITQKTIPAIFCGKYGQECREARNRAFEIIESDVMAGVKGRLYIGEWYLNCWIYGISNSDYLISERVLYSDLKVVTDDPVWRKEKFLSFGVTDIKSETGIDFPFEFPFDFGKSVYLQNSIENDFLLGADFVLTIYGAVVNPEVIINNHTYKIIGGLLDGERFIVDSRNKSLVKACIDDSIQNCFNKRYKKESIFEKIKYGSQPLSWTGAFPFDIVLIGKRSEPVWLWTEGPPVEDVGDVAVIDKQLYLLDHEGNFITDSDGNYINVSLPESEV